MWSWHWSPLAQTSLLLSPSDWLASFLKTTLANGVKVVKKVITSKFRFHLIAIYALGCFRNFSCTPVPTKITLKSPPTPVRLVKEWILMLLIKKQLIWKLFIYWYLMSFFYAKNVTKCLDQWLIFHWPQKKFRALPCVIFWLPLWYLQTFLRYILYDCSYSCFKLKA
jgi:hypothetical protein